MPASLFTSLTAGKQTLGVGAGAIFYLPTLCGMTAGQWAAMGKRSVVIAVHIKALFAAQRAQIKTFATSVTPAVALDQSDPDHTGVTVNDVATPARFYGDPAKPYLVLYSITGCDFYLTREQ